MENNSNPAEAPKNGGIGPVVVISVILIGIIIVLKFITG
jgi:hypothetical protein